MKRWYLVPAVLGFTICAALPSAAQERCPAPPALIPSRDPNFFNSQQEVYLGEIEAEELVRNYRVVRDDALSAYANGVLRKIETQLPDSGLHFQVTIIDLPVVDSFSLPGGKIYLTRKMVAFLRNEDELAGLLGHEMGHILTHQGAIEMTYQLKSLLNVTSVGDREDIFKKVNELFDNQGRNPKIFVKIARQEEPDQYQADQVALYLAASAGYSAQSFVDFLNRLANIRGKTGNRLTDFLGTTTPDQKRLRLLLQSMNALPQSCRAAASDAPSQQFSQWQSAVLAYSSAGQAENLYGLIAKQTLSPPLRVDFTNLKFSPDGHYLLAQDDSSIFVLLRTPFIFLFRIAAPDAQDAQFSPDSSQIVFVTKGMRVESWSIARQKRLSVHEVIALGGCARMLLSPDGGTLACLSRHSGAMSQDFKVSLLDVSDNSVLFEKELGSVTNPVALMELLLADLDASFRIRIVDMSFSPDSRYFALGGLDQAVAYDLKARAPVALHGDLSSLMKDGFAFLDPEHVIARNASSPEKSAVLQFPTGAVIERLPVQRQEMVRPAKGNYVILEPASSTIAAGVFDLQWDKYVAGGRLSTALDVYNHELVTQNVAGEIAINDFTSGELLARGAVPMSPLGTLRAEAVSPDLQWVAISGSNRGGVWNLSTGKQTYSVRGFLGAYVDSKKGFYADFPSQGTTARTIAHGDFKDSKVVPGVSIDDKAPIRQYGKYLFSMPVNRWVLSKDNQLKVQDAQSGNLLWSKPLPKEVPELFVNTAADTAILKWNAADNAAKDEIMSDPAIRERFSSLHDRASFELLEVLDSGSGKNLGELLVDTGNGSFTIRNAYATGDWVVLADENNRTLLYSLSTGEQEGTFFGTESALSASAHLLTIENQEGTVDVYTLPDMQKSGELDFPSPTSLQAYSRDGKKLLVVTADQVAYTFDTAALKKGRESAGSN